MLSDGVYSYTYDDEGNTEVKWKSGERWEYQWDYRNRLTEVKQLTGIGGTVVYEADYTYDVFDRRIGILEDKDGAGVMYAPVQTWTLYDGANAWADFDGNGDVTVRYLNGLGMDERYARIVPLEGETDANVLFYLGDNLGSVRQIVDTDGVVLDELAYSAFGEILPESTQTTGDRFRYTGREWDAGTGQYYYRARYYGADIGRFRSEDPIGFAGGDVNTYRYVRNGPLGIKDPTGLYPGWGRYDEFGVTPEMFADFLNNPSWYLRLREGMLPTQNQRLTPDQKKYILNYVKYLNAKIAELLGYIKEYNTLKKHYLKMMNDALKQYEWLRSPRPWSTRCPDGLGNWEVFFWPAAEIRVLRTIWYAQGQLDKLDERIDVLLKLISAAFERIAFLEDVLALDASFDKPKPP